MDKVLSARVDESVLSCIEILAQRLHATKKQIIEGAIKMYAKKIEESENLDILDHTFGSWKRKEPVKRTVTKARDAFRNSMMRHQR